MDFEIIDFHTHPFMTAQTNICNYPSAFEMTPEYTLEHMKELGVSKICGSVCFVGGYGDTMWDKIRRNNDEMLELKKLYGDFYVPGFHVHPAFVRESLEEIERMHKLGYNLIGELVPYLDGWFDYSDKNFFEILKLAEEYEMVLSLHSTEIPKQGMIAKEFPKLTVVAAHPGECWDFARHEECAKYENYLIDISGYGVFRHGMLRHAADVFGAERILYGSDYPTCNPCMYIGSVALDPSLTDSEKSLILAGNAKRILKL